MNLFPTRIQHAIAIVLNVAVLGSYTSPVRADHLARSTLMSISYLEQILVYLRRAGIVRALRGPGGGYYLERRPTQVTIAEVINALPVEPWTKWSGVDRLNERTSRFLSTVTVAELIGEYASNLMALGLKSPGQRSIAK